MKKKCEICGAEKTAENKLFAVRIATADDMGAAIPGSRVFCEVCLGYGTEMYESYMATKMSPKSASGGCRKKSR